MRGQNDGVSDVLYHAHVQALGEGLGVLVQLLENGVDMPFDNQADGVSVEVHKD